MTPTPTTLPVQFENHGQVLRGLLYQPSTANPTDRCVVLLHGWSGYRIGPGRMLTRAAWASAETGYPTLSFDFRGRGESEGEVTAASLGTMIDDAAQAIRFAVAETGCHCVTLIGLCSGAEVAIGASLSDPRIDSLALWSAPVFQGEFTLARQARRGASAAKGYLRKLLYPETWAKLFTGRLNLKLILRALSGGRSSEDAAVEDKGPGTAEQMAAFAGFPGRLLFVYGGSDPEAQPAWSFYQPFLDRHRLPYEYHEVDGANHNFYATNWQDEVIAATLGWLGQGGDQ